MTPPKVRPFFLSYSVTKMITTWSRLSCLYCTILKSPKHRRLLPVEFQLSSSRTDR